MGVEKKMAVFGIGQNLGRDVLFRQRGGICVILATENGKDVFWRKAQHGIRLWLPRAIAIAKTNKNRPAAVPRPKFKYDRRRAGVPGRHPKGGTGETKLDNSVSVYSKRREK